ncbi:hypothetical protein DdX_19574 [Ditylenchus destructor]|uniref:Uncharacterized protein n=1 Tax=Ditylenchus destructor TaxID=166010 RepID=A0AAD4MJG2_9BILA|nr:hypothetical protein DdX_19574 [Ditylenchus destructor]
MDAHISFLIILLVFILFHARAENSVEIKVVICKGTTSLIPINIADKIESIEETFSLHFINSDANNADANKEVEVLERQVFSRLVSYEIDLAEKDISKLHLKIKKKIDAKDGQVEEELYVIGNFNSVGKDHKTIVIRVDDNKNILHINWEKIPEPISFIVT